MILVNATGEVCEWEVLQFYTLLSILYNWYNGYNVKVVY